MFFVNAINRDAIVSHLCSIIIPPIFVCIGLLSIFGKNLSNHLLRRDTYNEKRIKVRRYGIVRVCCVCIFSICLILYFSFYRLWDMVILFVVALLGYAWIKFRTYSARLEYTYRYLIFCTYKKREIIPWKDVIQISWETPRGQIAPLLKIHFRSGMTAGLSSSDFVGLVNLKSFFELGYYKE